MIVEFVIQSETLLTAEENQYFMEHRPLVEWPYPVIPRDGDLINVLDFVDELFLSSEPEGDDTKIFTLSFDVTYVSFRKDGDIPIIEISVEGD